MEDRGTGITTKQILKAPVNSIYVWCNERIDYPKRLADELDRRDLRIVGPSVLEQHRLAGIDKELILDHSFKMTDEQFIGYEIYIARKRIKP